LFKKVNKYFIFIISLLLVLSNFSFATQQMLCLMNDDADADADVKCDCTCAYNEISQGITISNNSSPCCSTKTNELSNINNLQITGNELPKDITSFSPLYINMLKDITFDSLIDITFSALKEHVPKAEIPILFSSLLI